MRAEAEIVRVDGPGIPAPLDDVFDEDPSPVRLNAVLEAEGHLLVIAVEGGRTVGQCAAMVLQLVSKGPELFVENLGVAPSHRRRGIATALLAEVGAWGREHGCDVAWVATEPDNDAANALYAAWGSEAEASTLHVVPLTRSGRGDGVEDA